MSAVFSHGRLRLYLLKLLSEGPKHGYELIRLLENRFLGLYAPSAGTIYPRLQRLEAEGLVTRTAVGGRKVYEITDRGRAELRQRRSELGALEAEIHASVADLSSLANEIQQEVRGSVRDIKRELREATRQARAGRDRSAWSYQSWAEPTTPPASGTQPARDLAALEQRAAQLATEVRRLARRPGVAHEALRAATVVVDSALAELRRLLR
ncbi:MAG TPA: PadR family transcriptional regulator [Micromonosporaceae bacterium]